FGDLRHDAVPDLRREYLLHRPGGEHGRGAAVRRHEGETLFAAECEYHDPPDTWRCGRTGDGCGDSGTIHAQIEATLERNYFQTYQQVHRPGRERHGPG